MKGLWVSSYIIVNLHTFTGKNICFSHHFFSINFYLFLFRRYQNEFPYRSTGRLTTKLERASAEKSSGDIKKKESLKYSILVCIVGKFIIYLLGFHNWIEFLILDRTFWVKLRNEKMSSVGERIQRMKKLNL